MAALVAMTAMSVFHNPQIINRREGAQSAGTVETGDPFDAPWHVALDLARGGLARPDRDADLVEPTEPLDPHPSISAPDLKRVNARRPGRAPRDTGEAGSAVTGAALSRAPAALEATPRVETDPAPATPAGTTDGAGAAPLAPATPAAPQGVTASAAKSNVPPIPPAPAVEAPKP